MFTGNENHRITLAVGSVLTAAYRLLAGPLAIKGEYFSKAALQEILAQDGCVGIRVYYASETLIPKLVVVGVNANGNDLVDGYIAEMGSLCPPNCSTPNALNS